MSTFTARQIVLAARPEGKPKLTDFRLEETAVPTPTSGQLLLEVQYLSLDSYMRGRMDDRKSYAKPLQLGDVMVGETVAKVICFTFRRIARNPRVSSVKTERGVTLAAKLNARKGRSEEQQMEHSNHITFKSRSTNISLAAVLVVALLIAGAVRPAGAQNFDTAFGTGALASNVSGSDDSAFGFHALNANTTGVSKYRHRVWRPRQKHHGHQ
jgi:hypothetical protein